MVSNEVGFLITCFDQLREVAFTINMLRTKWVATRKAPIVLVVSGDHNRSLMFRDDDLTRVIHLDDIVGGNFRRLVSTSIMRQIEHGMLEMRDLERYCGSIENIIHMHGDILLLGEDGFFSQLNKWKESGKPVAADPVSANGPSLLSKDEFADVDEDVNMKFYGTELMPQLFAVDHMFCKTTGFMYEMSIIGNLERYATEWALIGNLHRAVHEEGGGEALIPQVNVDKDERGPYENVYANEVYTVKSFRQQWGLHKHWGGFCHYGNSIHFSKEQREARNEMALRQYNINLEAW